MKKIEVNCLKVKIGSGKWIQTKYTDMDSATEKHYDAKNSDLVLGNWGDGQRLVLTIDSKKGKDGELSILLYKEVKQ